MALQKLLQCNSACLGQARKRSPSPSNASCRYRLPIVIVVINNNGIYGGDRRPQLLQEAAQKGAEQGGFKQDPIPTEFVRDAK